MLFAGGPDRVVERIRAFHEATGVGVIDLILQRWPDSPDEVQHSIELVANEVLPRIHEFALVEAS